MQRMQDIYYVIPTGEMSVEHFLALYTTVVKNGQDTQSIEALDVPGCQRLTLMSDHCPDTYQLMLKEGRPIAACDELAMTTWRIG
ncbi:hypothetical protein [Nissabacter sp. SGAir0207]|uniref:hypothetical protein n=1 Tax=Nissabacter sp. SGAir0207 TaxID=2126321 RepID=UPI0019805B93|nr:hypothetical protein [Nissabacter sp. SGAir0207]